MKFGFIAKHRNVWPVAWLGEAMGVSRSGFHAWLNRSPSARSRSDETVGQQAKASFLASDRTYGARRVSRDLLADGVECGLRRIERLMRLQALRARPRRRRLVEAPRQVAPIGTSNVTIRNGKKMIDHRLVDGRWERHESVRGFDGVKNGCKESVFRA